jgi:FkbM family methyltransferase
MNELVRGKNKIDFKLNGRQFSFSMTYDADNACDRDMMSEFQSLGICEPEVVCAMERIVREGDTVIDGGANIGFFTIYLAQLVGPKGNVIAIEPGQNNIWKLEENVRLNKLKNVEIIRKPLWLDHSEVTLYMRQEGGRNSLWSDEGYLGKAKIKACTLADFPPHRLVKLDIEGAEVAALIGYSETDYPPFVIAEMNNIAMGYLDFDQNDLRSNGPGSFGFDTFLLQKDGNLPMLVPEHTTIVTERQNVNILLSSIEDVGKVWTEVRI